MNIRRLFLSALFMMPIVVSSCSKNTEEPEPDNPNGNQTSKEYPLTRVAIIPQPKSITYGTSNIAVPEVKEKQDGSLGEEEYKVDITPDAVNITYATEKGLLWARQTVNQILLQQTEVKGIKTIPKMSITDAPRYGWRSFHLDVARHMYKIDFLKKLIDCLAFYKINHLHLHLTDDQGWRVEIKKYPALTQVGAWRTFDKFDEECNRMALKDPAFAIDQRFIRNGNEYGGYYTQSQLKDLVAYAMERGINVIPEIDMPGHLTAAIKCYPEMQCNGTTGWGEEFSFPICAGRDENYIVMKDILDEVMQIFPGKYIHIGADEVNKDPWKTCGKCQAKMRANNLRDEEALCNYFVKQIADYLKTKGRTVMAWDDAYYAPEPLDLVYTFWRDWKPQSPATITQSGKKMIFMEWGHFYFSGDANDTQLKELYNYSPDNNFPGIQASNMPGYQACVFTEVIPNAVILGRHVFPSLQAFAELTWSEKRNWESFTERLPWHVQWVKSKGVTVRNTQYQ